MNSLTIQQVKVQLSKVFNSLDELNLKGLSNMDRVMNAARIISEIVNSEIVCDVQAPVSESGQN